jgi:hypothetical protein
MASVTEEQLAGILVSDAGSLAIQMIYDGLLQV